MHKNTLHIVFSIQANFVIEQSKIYDADESDLVYLQDILSIGPISDLETKYGTERRINWLAEMSQSFPASEIANIVQSDIDLVGSLKDDIAHYQRVYLWTGSDVNEILSASRLLHSLRVPDSVQLFILNFLDISVPGRFGERVYPKSLNETAVDQVTELYRHFRLAGSRDIGEMQSLWETLGSGDAHLRIANETSRIMEAAIDFYDSRIIAHCTKQYQPAIRVVGKTLGHINGNIREGVVDSFLEWRLKQLIEAGKLKYRGSFSSMRTYEVKRS